MMQAFSLAHPLSQPPETVLPGLSAPLVALLTQAAAPDRVALVGGAVRDLLRHRLHNDPWTGLPDLDLVVEGGHYVVEPPPAADAGSPVGAGAPSASAEPDRDATPSGCAVQGDGEAPAAAGLPAAHRLARRLRRSLEPGDVPFYQEHAAYGTVELEVLLPDGPLLLDVATARRETYPEPARNPCVCFARLEDDLARRDFTINAMALVLGGAGAEHRAIPTGVATTWDTVCCASCMRAACGMTPPACCGVPATPHAWASIWPLTARRS
jgi:poly(A) polymerase